MAHKSEDHSDMSLFKNRLWALMEEKGIETGKDLATKLYDAGLVDPHSKSTSYMFDDPNKARNDKIQAIQGRVNRSLNADTADGITSDLIKAYSVFFGCSTDYLLGLIPYKNHKVTDIRKETGLSVSAIDQLMEMHESASDRLIPLDFLLENESFKQVLSLFSMYRDRFGKMDVSQNISDFYGFKPESMNQAIEENVNAIEALDYNVSRKFMNAYDEWTESEQKAAKGAIEKEFPGIHNTKKHP